MDFTRITSDGYGTRSQESIQRDKSKQREFYRVFKMGGIDESRITNDGWKAIYEYELEKGYTKPDEIPLNIINKFNIDTSIYTPEPIATPDFINTEIEPEIEKRNLFQRIGDFFRNEDNVLKPEQLSGEFPGVNRPYPEFNKPQIEPSVPMDTRPFSPSIEPEFGKVESLARREENDPLLMALENMTNPDFVGQQTKAIIDGYNRGMFRDQREELNLQDEYLPEPNKSNLELLMERAKGQYPAYEMKEPMTKGEGVSSFDGHNRPYKTAEDLIRTKEKLIKAKDILEAYNYGALTPILSGLEGANKKLIDMSLEDIKGLQETFGDKLPFINKQVEKVEERMNWKEEDYFNAFFGNKSKEDFTKGEKIAMGIGSFSGNIGKLILFSKVMGTPTKVPMIDGALPHAITGAESAHRKGESPTDVIKEALISTGAYIVGGKASELVGNKLTESLAETFKKYPEWGKHLTALVRTAKGFTHGSTGMGTRIVMSEALQKENDLKLKDAIQSGIIMGVYEGMISYVPWNLFVNSEKERNEYNVKLEEIDEYTVEQQGYIKLSKIQRDNPYGDDIYINPQTKEILVVATRENGFLVPKSMSEGKLDEQTLRLNQMLGTNVGPRTQKTEIGQFDDSHTINRDLLDAFNKVFVKDMIEKGYKEFKPGLWVLEEGGKIVDVRPEFTSGKDGKPIPLFDIKTGDKANIDLENIEGFIPGSKYDLSRPTTGQINPYVKDAQKEFREFVSKEFKDPKLKDEKEYMEFLENIKSVENARKSIENVERGLDNQATISEELISDYETLGEAKQSINDFFSREDVKLSTDMVKDMNLGKKIEVSQIMDIVKRFNREYNKHFNDEEIEATETSVREEKVDTNIKDKDDSKKPTTKATEPTTDIKEEKTVEPFNVGETKTNTPIKTTLYHGSGLDKSEIYSGLKKPILGEGKYYATSEEEAKFYGDNVVTEEVELNNPLVIDDDMDWRKLTSEANWKFPNIYGLNHDVQSMYIDDLNTLIKSKGYDGVIIRLSYDSDKTKTMRNLFGHDQVIKFEDTTKPTGGIAKDIHRTSKENAEKILSEGVKLIDEDSPHRMYHDNVFGNYFYTSPESEEVWGSGSKSRLADYDSVIDISYPLDDILTITKIEDAINLSNYLNDKDKDEFIKAYENNLNHIRSDNLNGLEDTEGKPLKDGLLNIYEGYDLEDREMLYALDEALERFGDRVTKSMEESGLKGLRLDVPLGGGRQTVIFDTSIVTVEGHKDTTRPTEEVSTPIHMEGQEDVKTPQIEGQEATEVTIIINDTVIYNGEEYNVLKAYSDNKYFIRNTSEKSGGIVVEGSELTKKGTEVEKVETPPMDQVTFNEGDKVTFELNDENLTGTIESVSDYGEKFGTMASVRVDQISTIGGRIPIGRIELINIDRLEKLDSTKEIATPTTDTTTEETPKATVNIDSDPVGTVITGKFGRATKTGHLYWHISFEKDGEVTGSKGTATKAQAIHHLEYNREMPLTDVEIKLLEKDVKELTDDEVSVLASKLGMINDARPKEIDKHRTKILRESTIRKSNRIKITTKEELEAYIKNEVINHREIVKLVNDKSATDKYRKLKVEEWVRVSMLLLASDKKPDRKFNNLFRKYNNKEFMLELSKEIYDSLFPKKEITTTTEEVNKEELKETKSTNIGYHAGDLGKAESYFQMVSGNRGTGHYGTGTYFVGDKEKLVGSYKNRPLHEINFDGYNLFKPTSESDAKRLHDTLKFVNNYHNEVDLIKNLDNIDEEKLKLQRLNDEMQDHGPDTKELKDLQEKIKDFTKDTFLLTDDDIRKVEEDVEKRPDEDKPYFYAEYLLEAIEKNIKHGGKIYKIKNGYSDFTLNTLMLNINESKALELLEEIQKEVKEELGDNWFYSKEAQKADSPSTRFMKKLGYDGVDVRHIKSFDNVDYGSVIYDLKTDTGPIKEDTPIKGIEDIPMDKILEKMETHTSDEWERIIREVLISEGYTDDSIDTMLEAIFERLIVGIEEEIEDIPMDKVLERMETHAPHEWQKTLAKQRVVKSIIREVLMEEGYKGDLLGTTLDTIFNKLMEGVEGDVSRDSGGLRGKSTDDKTTDTQEVTSGEETTELPTEPGGKDNRGNRTDLQSQEGKRGSKSRGETETSINQHDDSTIGSNEGVSTKDGEVEEHQGVNRELLPVDKNYYFKDEDTLFEGGPKTRINNNIKAIEVLRTLEKEGRGPTLEEQKAMIKYVGWGGLPQIFDEKNKTYEKERKILKELITDEEYKNASASTLNAHYTDPKVVEKIYDIAKSLGFNNGRILEPSMGIGYFFGMLPNDLRNSILTGIELDTITGNIAKHLYPEANIFVEGYQDFKSPDNYYDLAVGNVPFGNYKVFDNKYNKLNLLIHDYFIVKTLDKVKPGGLAILITSKGTMDKVDRSARTQMFERGDLISAIRLPNNAFKESARTEVTTDILVFRKRKEGEKRINPEFLNTKTDNEITINSYYSKNPDNLLGVMKKGMDMYGNEDETYLEADGRDIYEAIDEIIKGLDIDTFNTETVIEPLEEVQEGKSIFKRYEKDGSYRIVDGKVYTVTSGGITPRMQKIRGKDEYEPLKGKTLDRIVGMVEIKNVLKELLEYQLNDAPEKVIKDKMKELNKVYDAFVKKNGYINSNANARAFGKDPDYPLLSTLEMEDRNNPEKYNKSDRFTKRTISKREPITSADNPFDGLVYSMYEKGMVDIDYISKLTNLSKEEVVNSLKGRIYIDPLSEKYLPSDEYLSGDVVRKLDIAREFAKTNKEYEENVKALEKVIPTPLKASEIEFQLGTPWILADIYSEFLQEIFKDKYIKVKYMKERSLFEVEASRISNAINTIEYGTNKMSAIEIIDKLLNGKPISVTIKYEDEFGKKVKNHQASTQATMLARSRAKKMQREFKDWLYKDINRRAELEKIYNRRYNNIVLRDYSMYNVDSYEGMNENIVLRGYQKRVVTRAVMSGNTLLAHTVGSGKTFTMITIGMELKRLGIANKPMYVVPNSLLKQWSRDVLLLYPNANVLMATKDDLSAKNRQIFLGKVANNNYDAIVIPHSSFGLIPVSKETQIKFIKEEIESLRRGLDSITDDEKKESSRTIKGLETTLKNMENKLKELLDSKKDDFITFEELGVDYLFVDEAHNFKNLQYHTKKQVSGIQNTGAKKTQDMYMKARYIQGLHNNKGGLVFATGTPISNSIPEVYTMMRYLYHDRLKELGFEHFDAWADTFGQIVTKVEIDKTGQGLKEKDRFSKFMNVPELIRQFREFTDVLTDDDLKRELKEEGADRELPKIDGGKPIIVEIEPSEELELFIEGLIERSLLLDKGGVDPKEDNHLNITNEGRIASLDLRLIDTGFSDYEGSKINVCVDNVYKEYLDGKDEFLTQLIFSDLGTPKDNTKKTRKKAIRFKGYEEYKWYYDVDKHLKYIVVSIDKENDEIMKLYENEDLVTDDLFENNMDAETIKPEEFDLDIDLYIENMNKEDYELFDFKFDVYNDLKEKLIEKGIPEKEIAFIHDAKSDEARATLFDKVKKGQVRVLIGSTAKMGEGMNVQDRLVALHHLDVPWKPANLIQREGRILRFGNMNEKIRIYNYVTKKSFDAYIWQLITNKAMFISNIMSGNLKDRIVDDFSDPIVMNSQTAMASAMDDKRYIRRFELEKEIRLLEEEERAFRNNKFNMESRIEQYKRQIKNDETLIPKLKKDLELSKKINEDTLIEIDGLSIVEKKETGKLLREKLENVKINKDEIIGKIGDFDIIGSRTINQSLHEEAITKQFKISAGNIIYPSSIGRSHEDTVDNIKEAIKGISYHLHMRQRDVKRLTEEMAEYEEQLKKDFEYGEKLEELREEFEALTLELGMDKASEIDSVEIEETISVSDTKSSIPSGSEPRKRTREPKEDIKRTSDIVNDIKKDFDLSISSKRFRSRRGSIGQFQTHSHAIRVKEDNDIDTILHELGHYFDLKYKFSTKYKKIALELEKELNLSELYKDEEIPGEVIAEFVRLYATTENEAKNLSEEFYNIFTKEVDKEDLDNLNKHREDILDNFNANKHTRIGSTIRSHTEKEEISFDTKKVDFEMEYFDDLAPLRLLSEWIEKTTGQKLNFTDDPYVLANFRRLAGMRSEEIVHGSLFTPEGEIIGVSFSELLKDITRDQRKDFDAYLKTKHAITLFNHGKRVFPREYTKEYLTEALEEYEEKYPHFKGVSEDYYEWWELFTDNWVVKEGFLDRATFEHLNEIYPSYAPNFRYLDDVDVDSRYDQLAKKGFGNQSSPIKRMKGSTKDTYAVIESLVLYIDKIVKTQMSNQVGRAIHYLYHNVEGLSNVLTKIDHETELNKFNAIGLKAMLQELLVIDYIDNLPSEEKKEAQKILEERGVPGVSDYLIKKGIMGPEIIDTTIDDIITYFTPRMFSTDGSVFTVVDKQGKTHFYQVHDKLFLEAILNLGESDLTKWTKRVGKIKRVFTTLTTGANPIFGLTSNIWGDVPEAYVFGSYNNPLEFGKELALSVVDVFKEKKDKDKSMEGIKRHETLNLYYSMGGGASSMISPNRKLMEETLNNLFPDLKKKDLKTRADAVLSAIEKFNDTIETGPRYNEFKKVLDKYGNTYEGRLRAIYESQEVTVNFLRKGRIQSSFIGQGVPFLSAGLQGMYKLNQEFGRRRGRGRDDIGSGDGGKGRDNKKFFSILLKSLICITIFEIVQMIAYKDDEDYQRLSAYTKDNYWCIPSLFVKGRFIKIRKPRELGLLFGTMFRRGFMSIFENDPKAWDDFMISFMNVMLPPNPATEHIFSPFVEVARNKDWKGTPIVPSRLDWKDPSEQYDINTTEISKAVAKAMSKLGMEFSPMKMDYLIQQYTGGIGQILIPATAKGTTVLESLSRKVTTDVAYSNDLVNDFYTTKEKLDKANRQYNDDGRKNKDFDPVKRHRYNEVYKEISPLWSEIEEIKNDNSISLKQRKEKEREIRLRMLEMVSEENLKPTPYNEFKVLYQRGQDLTSKYKEEFEETKVRPKLTKEEERLLIMYNVPVDGKRSQLSSINYNIDQIDKRINQVIDTDRLPTNRKEQVLKDLEKQRNEILTKYMSLVKTKQNIDIKGLFK